jgi:glycogen debranching enzyme
MARTLDSIHTSLSYVRGSLKNATVVVEGAQHEGFIFSLLNPPVPLGGNIISLDVFVDEIPLQKKEVYVATSDATFNASLLSDTRPIPFKPFQNARFLVVNGKGLGRGRHEIMIMSKMEGFEQITIPFSFADTVGSKKEKIVLPSDPSAEFETDSDTVFGNYSSPLILSGKKAYIVCSASGTLSAQWTWMGARYDNGGLYVPPARVFGRVVVEVTLDDGVRKRVPNFVAWSRHENGVLYTRHELAGLEVKRRLFVPPENRGFVMVLNLRLVDSIADDAGRGKKRKVRIHFMVDGNITSYGLAAVSQSNVSHFDSQNNCLIIGTAHQKLARYFGVIGVAPKNLVPYKVLTDSFDNDLELSYDLEVGQEPTEMALVGTGSFSSEQECLGEYLEMRDNYSQLLQQTDASFRSYSASTAAVRQAGERSSTEMNKMVRAFNKAKTAMQYLKGEYDGLGQGICAGLPRFPNYWARDTGWSLRGYLAIGDYFFARQVIDNFLRRQATGGNGVTKGELPMIISGKAFLHSTTYGSADSTFLFPRGIKEYVTATGDLGFLKSRWKSIVDLVDWGLHKDLDGDGLIEHGFSGTADILPIQDSTWMDHIDRRKSANDVQALFYESLTVGSDLARLAGDEKSEQRWSQRAKALKETIDREYWNPAMGFYFDTVRKDGSKDPSIRPNALVLLLADAEADRAKAVSVMTRVEKDDMTAPWGVRTLSNFDPKYQPTLYHDGAVWPLVTGWAALAELKLGRFDQAAGYISSMAGRILAENGMYAETYRGDRPEPFNSCILQAWSMGMYTRAFLEMILGLQIDMPGNKILIEPKIPDEMKSAIGRMEFEHPVATRKGLSRLQVTIDAANEKVSVQFRDRDKKPEIFSSYLIS